jgi:hypothetical protein
VDKPTDTTANHQREERIAAISRKKSFGVSAYFTLHSKEWKFCEKYWNWNQAIMLPSSTAIFNNWQKRSRDLMPNPWQK